MSSQHLSLHHLSISGIFQLLVTQFWPSFKGRFLGLSLTDANIHVDICSSNICPYQHNLNCYLPDFDQTFGTQFFAPISQLLQTQFWPNFWDPIFWGPWFLWTKIFLDKISIDPSNFFYSFLTQIFVGPNKLFVNLTFLFTYLFFGNIVFVPKSFGQ